VTTAAPDWSPQQIAALKAAEDWFCAENAPQIFRLFGYAGTGKTTLALEIARRIRDRVKSDEDTTVQTAVLFAAFTGKAALVMQSKGCRAASTIHRLIYTLDEDVIGPPKFVLNEASALADAQLLIVDECSMVGAELAHDMLHFGKKILVLGDPAQLPPVQDAGYFTEAKPDVMLSEVHRQAEGNPIIRLSMDIRAGARLEYGDYGACKVVRWSRDAITAETILAADQLLVGRNITRTRMNDRVRTLKKLTRETPVVGEKLVCLKNDHSLNLFNGGLWRVAKLRKFNPAAVRMVIEPDDAGEAVRSVEVKVNPAFFLGTDKELTWDQLKETQQLTYGYALTVHKAQGSQWNDVILFDESRVFGNDARRWLYTGVTRAAKTLTVVM
jgi:exodeoxyribonuclease V